MAAVAWDIQMCAVPSHRNDIPMNKPVFFIYAPHHNRFVSKVVRFYV